MCGLLFVTHALTRDRIPFMISFYRDDHDMPVPRGAVFAMDVLFTAYIYFWMVPVLNMDEEEGGEQRAPMV